MAEPCIVAMGGGGFSMEPRNPLLDRYILSQVESARPRVCMLAQAGGESDNLLTRFYSGFKASRCEPSHLSLFNRCVEDLQEHLLSQDIVYVGGGNTANMLAIWRVHGLDHALRAAWEAGVVLCGLSAGSLCWFESGVTDSFGLALQPLADGLGFLPGSHCPHYDGEERRRPVYQEAVRSGSLPGGLALDDGVAARFRGTERVELVSSRPAARGWLVESTAGKLTETELIPRFLG